MFKGEKKINITVIFLIVLVALFISSFFYFYLNYKKNLEFKNQISCQELGQNYSYDSEINRCILSEEENNVESNTSDQYLCDFSVDLSRKDRYHVDGLDLENIKKLEEKCQGGNDIMSKFACLNLETEKDKIYHRTYFEIEGTLKTMGNEHLQLIGVEINRIDSKRTVLGQAIVEIEKDVNEAEETPFSIKVMIDRDNEDINKIFQKDDETLISIHPVYSTCR